MDSNKMAIGKTKYHMLINKGLKKKKSAEMYTGHRLVKEETFEMLFGEYVFTFIIKNFKVFSSFTWW